MPRPLNPTPVWNKDHYRFRCRTRDGGRPWVHLDAGLTLAEAKKAALEIAKVASAQMISQRAPKKAVFETVEIYSKRWIEAREKAGIVSTGEPSLRLYILPIIGQERMAIIGTPSIERVVHDLDRRVLAGDMSSKTACNHWGIVVTMFDDASRSKDRTLRVRVDNPAFGVRGPDHPVAAKKTTTPTRGPGREE